VKSVLRKYTWYLPFRFTPKVLYVFLIFCMDCPFIMVCFSVCLSKHHTKIHTGEYSNGICALNSVPAVRGHKMSDAYPSHIISDANCIGGWVGPRAGLDVVEKRLTPTPLRNVAVVLLHTPALPKQCSAEHRQGLRQKSSSKQAYINISNTTKNAKCAPHIAEIFVWQLAILS
jgi:hypothetical protein